MSITAQMGGERVQSSGSKQRMADALAKAVDVGDSYDRRIEQLEAEKAEIRTTIEKLPVKEYNVLHMRYFQNKSYDEIGFDNGMSKSWATTIHGRALKRLQKILDKV
jgi:RNA polymerase sigma factor (sigma-70 family)